MWKPNLKLTYIDEKGKLFGKINVLDFLVILGAVILLYLGSSAIYALNTNAPKIIGFVPKRVNSETESNVKLLLNNTQKIALLKADLVPQNFVGNRVTLGTLYHKCNMKEATLSVPATAPAGDYFIKLEKEDD